MGIHSYLSYLRDQTTEAIDYRQIKPALERCATTLGRKPKQIVADGDYLNDASLHAAAEDGEDSTDRAWNLLFLA